VKQAVCVFIRNGEGKVLAVSRRNDPNNWGLPGGKVDPGETLEAAAVREAFEETGLVIAGLKAVFTADVGDGYACTTFTATVVAQARESLRGGDGETGLVDWVSEIDLLEGSFGDYNSSLIDHLFNEEHERALAKALAIVDRLTQGNLQTAGPAEMDEIMWAKGHLFNLLFDLEAEDEMDLLTDNRKQELAAVTAATQVLSRLRYAVTVGDGDDFTVGELLKS